MTRPTSPQRTLAQHMQDWSIEQVAALIESRPDLVYDYAPESTDQLADRAQYASSFAMVIQTASLPQNRMMQLLACYGPDMALSELAAALPEGTALTDAEPVLATLEAAAVMWRHDGRVYCSTTLGEIMPTTFGPSIRLLAQNQTVDYLKFAIANVRDAVAKSRLPHDVLPGPAAVTVGRTPRKNELIDELQALLRTGGVVAAVLSTATDEAAEIARDMAMGRPLLAISHSLYYARHYSTYYQQYPTYWLFERALLLGTRDDIAAQPLEVGLALRGGRPVGDLAIEQPRLVSGTVNQSSVDESAAARITTTLHRMSDLLEAWADTPAKMLKYGGIGATVVKQSAALMQCDITEAARLIELLHLAGLIETKTTTRKEKRQYVHDYFAVPSGEAADWQQRDLAVRWRQLAAAWLRTEQWPSASGYRDPDDKTKKPLAVLSPTWADEAPARRRDVLTALASLAEGEASNDVAIVDSIYWQSPQPWLTLNVNQYVRVAPASAIQWIYAETDLLGVAALGALSSFGRALVTGPPRAAEAALAVALPEPATTFTLQADLTATVIGVLAREVLTELRLMADLESSGAASTFRFSDASLRRALDAGRQGEAILAFLKAHATKGVPKPLAYLVGDVARRHGNLRVGPASSFVVSEDPAVLVDACSHRRTRKLALRLLAPTVAVSTSDPDQVMQVLRDAGFLPAAALDDAATITLAGDASKSVEPAGGDTAPAKAAATKPAAAATKTQSKGPGDLPERYRSRSGRSSTAAVMRIPAKDAAAMAAAIVNGKPAGKTRAKPGGKSARGAAGKSASPGASRAARPGFEQTDLFDEAPSLAAMATYAAKNGMALGLNVGDTGSVTDLVMMTVVSFDNEMLTGVDLLTDEVIGIRTSEITAAFDLGPVDDILDEFEPPRLQNPPPRRSRYKGRYR